MTKHGSRVVDLLGPGAILSLADACGLVPLRLSQSRKAAWMRAHNLVRDFDGLECVIWGDLLSALRGEGQGPPVIVRPKAKDPWDTLERAPVGRK